MHTWNTLRLTSPSGLLIRISILGLCLAIGAISTPAIAASTARIAPDEMPVAVRQVLAAKYPGWTVDHATQIEAEGKPAYRIRLADNTMEIDVVLDAAGHIVEAARGVADAGRTMAKPEKDGKSDFKKPKVYGYAQMFYRQPFDTGSDGRVDNSNFRMQRVRVGVKGKINSWASYEIEIDPRAPEVSGILRDAFLRLDVIPNHEIRLGQQKTQFGYENRESSTELFEVNRAEVSDNLSRGINLRDIGVGLIGKVPLNDTWRLEDAITIVSGAGMNVQDDNTPRKNVWGRVGLRHKVGDSWERIGISGGTGDFIDVGEPDDPTDDELTKFDRIGVDVEIDRKWFFLSAEYVYGVDDVKAIGEPPGPDPAEFERMKLDGYYLNLVGKTPWKIGPILRYDSFDNVFSRWTIGAYYGEPKDRFRVLLNYEYRDKFEDSLGHIGRGDDKLYLWTQWRF